MDSFMGLELFGGGGESSSSSPPVRRMPSRSHTTANLRDLRDFGGGVEGLPVSTSEGDFFSLPPEPQQGNIEYKLKLVNPTSQKLQHLITQMKWRLREGQGEAIYEIGVEDNGLMTGLSESDMESSLYTLREMASRLCATTQVLRTRIVAHADDKSRSVAEILVRKVPDDQQCIDLRVCVMGSADVGKSTLLGVLTQGELDNGRGRARLNMFRHLHEVQTGRTSSISHEILGFDSLGNPIDYGKFSSTEEIFENSSKLITFVDLAGHQKYFHTTISGLTSYSPHYIMLVISACGKISFMTRECLGIVNALDLPFFIVITKIDTVSQIKLQGTIDNLSTLLTSIGINKVPFIVKTVDDVITAASNTLKQNSIPMFTLSAVNGSGLELIKKFFHLLPPRVSIKEREKLEQDPPEFQIDELFDVPGVGTVAGGLVSHGIIIEGMSLNVGPFNDGAFFPVKINSIKRSRAGCRIVRATQSAALALDISLDKLRKGMVLLDPHVTESKISSCQYFQAVVSMIFHSMTIYKGFRSIVHIGNVHQTAVVIGVQPCQGNKNKDCVSALWRFIKNPEYIKVGSRLLFREGKNKGIGRITKIFPLEQVTLSR